MVVEIPRYEQGKFEICKKTPLNPIVQDIKKGNVRFLNNIYPFNGYPCNYGSIPQTWEDPNIKFDNQFKGDNDPLDICDISSGENCIAEIGSIKNVKILGCLAMIDDNEIDWKILSVDTNYKFSDKLNSIDDVERNFPDLLKNLKKWFKNYKLPMDKPENAFAFDGKWLDKQFAYDVIENCSQRWRLLADNDASIRNTADLPYVASQNYKNSVTIDDLHLAPPTAANSIPASYDQIYYYKA